MSDVSANGPDQDRAGWPLRDVKADGLFGAPEVNVVLRAEAYSSVFLTLRMLGFGSKRVHVADADTQGRMGPGKRAEVLRGIDGPTFVCLQAGNHARPNVRYPGVHLQIPLLKEACQREPYIRSPSPAPTALRDLAHSGGSQAKATMTPLSGPK